MPKGALAEPAFVGREKELEELAASLNSAVEGKGRTVFVSGEAGGGKTRLAREFLNTARKKGVAVMAGWCLSDAQVPFFPFMEAFNNYYAANVEEETAPSPMQPQGSFGVGGAAHVGMEGGELEITSWLTGTKPGEKLGKPAVLSPQAWKDQVFAATAKTLQTIAAQAPVVLFIEDVHWADSASLALLHYVARAVDNSQRVLVLATFRSEELTADAEGHPHPLAETLRMMRREELFDEIKLLNLNQDSVSEMAESMMGARLQKELAEKLTVESRGNPLFVVESLRMLNERKSLVQENNEWRLAVDELGIPNKIKEVILRRLACLKYAQRRVLDAASVIGEEFDVELLSIVLGQDYLEILETLNVVAHSTSLVCVEEGHYRFDHARSRETLCGELALPLRRGYHNKIAEKLESSRNEVPRLSDISYHYAQAGNKEKAVKFALAAGQDALEKYSNAQAIAHFQYVLQNLPDECAEEKKVALGGLGDAYAASSMYSEAIKTFDELASSETGVLKLHAIRKATDAAYAKGDMPDLLIEYAKKAEELGLNDRLEMARIIDNRGKAWGWAGRGTPDMDLADYDAALKVFEEENSLLDVAEALWRSGAVSALFFDELRERGLSELIRSVAIFKELGDIRKQLQTTFWKAQGLTWNLLSPEAKPELEKVLMKGEKLGSFYEMYQACWNLSYSALYEDRIQEALFYAQKSVYYANKMDSTLEQGTDTYYLAAVYSLAGNAEKADEYFAKAAKLLPSEFALNIIHRVPQNLGVLYAAKGEWNKSEQNFKKQLESGAETPYTTIPLYRERAWALEKQGRLEDARACREEIRVQLARNNELVEKRFGHANVQLSLLLPRKLQVGEEFEMRLDMVNVGRKPASLVKVEGVVPPEFKFTYLPSFCNLQNGSFVVRDMSVGPFEVETFKLKFSATKAGSYVLNPEVFYVDDLDNMKTCKLDPIAVTVEQAKSSYEVLAGRVITGTMELDRLLLGGIPEKHTVVLAASSSDERQQLIKRFLEAGAKAGEITLEVTCEAGASAELAQQFQLNFGLLVCNLQADLTVQNLPNVYKLQGIENLTDVDIALTKYFRTLDTSRAGPKRAYIDLLSDVLLQHHAMIARKWLSSLLTNLKAKGFTTLAVLDPQMHPAEESRAIISLFDGEIAITEKEAAKGLEKILRVRKLVNQKYLEDELTLTKKKLSS